jgi:hypothetical protein
MLSVQYPKKLRHIFIYLLVTLIVTPLVTSSSTWARGWKRIRTQNGVKVYQRKEPKRDLPSFKGTGLVNADMYMILAVLRDGSRRKEWMSKSGVTRILRRESEFEAIAYQQTLAPWPVSDREIVMHTQVYLRSQPLEMIATFDDVKWSGSIRGVDRDDFVLMPYLRGYWRLTPKGPNRTEVTYMVNTDPGGLLPNFVIRRVTRDIPYWTLIGLRKQVKRSKNHYQEFLKSYDPKRASGEVKAVPPKPPASVLRRLN